MLTILTRFVYIIATNCVTKRQCVEMSKNNSLVELKITQHLLSLNRHSVLRNDVFNILFKGCVIIITNNV